MEAIILYRTDHHHSYASREVIGVFTNKRKLLTTVKQIVEEDIGNQAQDLDWYLEFFSEKGQTQGLNHFELSSQVIDLNTTI